MIERKFHNSFQLIYFADLTAFHYIGKDRRIINISNNCIYVILRIFLEMNCRKSAKFQIIRKFCIGIEHLSIFLSE